MAHLGISTEPRIGQSGRGLGGGGQGGDSQTAEQCFYYLGLGKMSVTLQMVIACGLLIAHCHA